MTTLIDIQNAVASLPKSERRALQVWLNSQAEPEITAQEEGCLLRSIDEATHDIDAGRGLPLEEVRQRVRSWAAR